LRLQVYSSERGYFSVLFEDVSKQREERERRENEQKRAVEEVSTHLYASRHILRNMSFNESAKTIFDSCKSLIGAKNGHVSLISKRVEAPLTPAS
jgi:hypothetical protein